MFSAELRRQLTGVTFLALVIFIFVFASSSSSEVFRSLDLSPAEVTQKAILATYVACIVSLIYGALFAARDFETNFVARQSFLAGGLSRLMAIKAFICLLVGVIFSVIAVGIAVISSAITLASRNQSLDLGPETFRAISSVVIVIVGCVMFSFVVGLLIRRALVATLLVVIYTTVFESFILSAAPQIGQWLFGGAAQSIINGTGTGTLPLGFSYLIFFGWILILGGASYLLSSRRDVII